MAFTKIENDTNIKDFPDIYNGNIDELIKKIGELETAISKKDAEIRKIKEDFRLALNALRAEYTQMFDQLNK